MTSALMVVDLVKLALTLILILPNRKCFQKVINLMFISSRTLGEPRKSRMLSSTRMLRTYLVKKKKKKKTGMVFSRKIRKLITLSSVTNLQLLRQRSVLSKNSFLHNGIVVHREKKSKAV